MNQKRNTIKIFSTLTAVLIIVLMQGCYYDKEELLYPGSTKPIDCTNVQSTFSGEVLHLVTTKCAIGGCHNAATAMGGKVFETYRQISVDTARIFTRAVKFKDMPPTGPLQPAEMKILNCWIKSGAPNN